MSAWGVYREGCGRVVFDGSINRWSGGLLKAFGRFGPLPYGCGSSGFDPPDRGVRSLSRRLVFRRRE